MGRPEVDRRRNGQRTRGCGEEAARREHHQGRCCVRDSQDGTRKADRGDVSDARRVVCREKLAARTQPSRDRGCVRGVGSVAQNGQGRAAGRSDARACARRDGRHDRTRRSSKGRERAMGPVAAGMGDGHSYHLSSRHGQTAPFPLTAYSRVLGAAESTRRTSKPTSGVAVRMTTLVGRIRRKARIQSAACSRRGRERPRNGSPVRLGRTNRCFMILAEARLRPFGRPHRGGVLWWTESRDVAPRSALWVHP